MKIYIAGKITGLDRAEVDAKFEKARAALVGQGHSVFVPTVLPEYADVPYDDYMHICFSMIEVCDAVWMMKDWQESVGARMELQFAADYGKEIIYEDESTRKKNFPFVCRGIMTNAEAMAGEMADYEQCGEDMSGWHYTNKGDMPEDFKNVLLLRNACGLVSIIIGYIQNGIWHGDSIGTLDDNNKVIAWQYLPEPPKFWEA